MTVNVGRKIKLMMEFLSVLRVCIQFANIPLGKFTYEQMNLIP